MGETMTIQYRFLLVMQIINAKNEGCRISVNAEAEDTTAAMSRWRQTCQSPAALILSAGGRHETIASSGYCVQCCCC